MGQLWERFWGESIDYAAKPMPEPTEAVTLDDLDVPEAWQPLDRKGDLIRSLQRRPEPPSERPARPRRASGGVVTPRTLDEALREPFPPNRGDSSKEERGYVPTRLRDKHRREHIGGVTEGWCLLCRQQEAETP